MFFHFFKKIATSFDKHSFVAQLSLIALSKFDTYRLKIGPHVVTNCDETIVSSFPIHLQFAFKLPPEVDWLNSNRVNANSVWTDQFELIRI